MHFVKFVYEKRHLSYVEASNMDMEILGLFLTDMGCDGQIRTKKWVFDDSMGMGFGTNNTFIEKEGDNILISYEDADESENDQARKARSRTTRKQFVQLLDDWWEKVCKKKPKEVVIKCENDQFLIETENLDRYTTRTFWTPLSYFFVYLRMCFLWPILRMKERICGDNEPDNFTKMMQIQVSNIADRFFPLKKARIISIGSSPVLEQVFLVHAGEKKGIIRINNFTKIFWEVPVFVGKGKIGPPFLGSYWSHSGYMFASTEYVPGRTLAHKDVKSPKILRLVAQLIKKLHDFGDKKEFSIKTLNSVNVYYKRIIEQESEIPKEYFALYRQFIEEEKTWGHDELVTCHHNLNPTNIIIRKDGTPCFIDWKWSAVGSRFDDLSFFAFTSDLSDDQSKELLEGYFERKLTKDEWKTFKFGQKRACFLIATRCFLTIKHKVGEFQLIEDPSDNDGPVKKAILACKSGDKGEAQRYGNQLLKRFEGWN